jgi:hypothetical protein
MIRKSIFDTPTTPRIFVFLEWVRDGQLFIPDFQRPFEWDDERRLNLLDSVSRGLPIGAFMVWRTMRELETYDNLGPFELPKPQPNESRTFLIDGHQRLVTLYSALQPLTPEGLEQLRRQGRSWPLYFNLEVGEGDPGFVIAPKRKGFEPPPTWLPTNELFVPKALWQRQRQLYDAGEDALVERMEALANAFKDYAVPVLPLVTDDMKAVTDSFVRINIGGKAMAEDKVLRALIYGDYRIDEHIEELREELAEIGWGQLEEQIFVNALKFRLDLDVYADPTSVVKAVKRRAESDSQDEAQTYRAVMSEVGRGLRAAAEVLMRCGVPGPGVLPYQYQLVCLAEVLLRWSSELSKEHLEEIREWFWRSTYSAYFTGMTGYQLRRTIEELLAVFASPEYSQLLYVLPEINETIAPIQRFQKSSIRSIVHLLAQAHSIPNADFRNDILERLGRGDRGTVHRIFPRSSGSHPGNIVLTTPSKLVELRKWLKTAPHEMPDDLAAMHHIPSDAFDEFSVLATNHQIFDFLRKRSRYLDQLEDSFIRSFSLSLALPTESPFLTDDTDDVDDIPF